MNAEDLKRIVKDKYGKIAEQSGSEKSSCCSTSSCCESEVDYTVLLDVKVHKQKEIKLPDSLLSEYNDSNELKSYHAGGTGIFSITVSAEKPVGCSCGGI
jgi:ethanolamine ammonia-lyase small subunit